MCQHLNSSDARFLEAVLFTGSSGVVIKNAVIIIVIMILIVTTHVLDFGHSMILFLLILLNCSQYTEYLCVWGTVMSTVIAAMITMHKRTRGCRIRSRTCTARLLRDFLFPFRSFVIYVRLCGHIRVHYDARGFGTTPRVFDHVKITIGLLFHKTKFLTTSEFVYILLKVYKYIDLVNIKNTISII